MNHEDEAPERDAPNEERHRPPADVHCSRCGAPAERGQLVCLECGSRIALTYKRPPRWQAAVGIAVAVFALFLIGALVALAAVGHDAKREVDASPPRPKVVSTPPREKTTPEKATTEKSPAATTDTRTDASAPAATDIVRRGPLYGWPRNLSGFTVVINSTEDRASATTYAESAAKSRPAKLGVIRADDFRTLPKGFYVVFAGHYGSRQEADKATVRLGKRFKGAFTQRVRR